MPKHLSIFCADIGSVEKERFGWFGVDVHDNEISGSCIEELANAITEKITRGEKVALGFECPLYVPFRDDPMDFTKARTGEGNRSWSAGAGCGALATGIVEVTWLLKKIRTKSISVSAFLDWKNFKKADRGLFLWEAFVSGKAKGSGHSDDARVAVESFQKALPNLDKANAISESCVISLVGASMLRAGWSENIQLLSERCLVIKATQVGVAQM